jgi:hypothetical protein
MKMNQMILYQLVKAKSNNTLKGTRVRSLISIDHGSIFLYGNATYKLFSMFSFYKKYSYNKKYFVPFENLLDCI